MVEYVCLGIWALEYMMRDSIYLIVLLNFLNRPLLGNWPTDYMQSETTDPSKLISGEEG